MTTLPRIGKISVVGAANMLVDVFRDRIGSDDVFLLDREPKNDFHSNAVRVLWRDTDEKDIYRPIGYVERDLADLLGPAIDAGAEVAIEDAGFSKSKMGNTFFIAVLYGDAIAKEAFTKYLDKRRNGQQKKNATVRINKAAHLAKLHVWI